MNADYYSEEFRDFEPSDCEPVDAEPTDRDSDRDELEEPSDLDFADMPCTDEAGQGSDESQWEAFLPDEDDWDPEPEPGDFWIGNAA